MSDRSKARPGWYPHPDMPSTQRYWDGAAWTDHVAPASAHPQGPSVGKIALGVAAGIAVILILFGFGYQFVHADDDLDCSIKQANGERC